jgi:hypothetical protein
MPELEASFSWDAPAPEEIEVPKEESSFPSITELTSNDRFKNLSAVRQAYTLGKYRNKLARHLYQVGEVKDEKQLHKALGRIDKSINKFMPSGNSISALMDSTVDRREVLSEIAGYGKSTFIQGLKGLVSSGASNINKYGKITGGGDLIDDSNIDQAVENFEKLVFDFDTLREDMEASLAEDKDIQGRDMILNQGLSLSSIGNAGSRMIGDVIMASGATMAAGPGGAYSYFMLTGAARSDRELRRSQPEMSERERNARSNITGFVSGSLESIGFGYLTNSARALKLTKVLQNSVPDNLRRVIAASGSEAVTEFAQTYVEHFGHNVEALDDFITIMQDEKVAKEALQSAAIGGILGGGLRGSLEISTPAIEKIIQTDVYKNARKKIHEKLDKIDFSKRVREPIADLSESIIKTHKTVREESKNLSDLQDHREAGGIVGGLMAEAALDRDIPVPQEAGFGIEIDGRFEKSDILSASEARDQGEQASVQESNIEAKDKVPQSDANSVEKIIRSSILEHGGIDIAKSSFFKDYLQDADGNPTFSPKFRSKKDKKGLPLDEHIEILAADGLISRDVDPEFIIQSLEGNVKDIQNYQNAQPTLEDLELMQENSDPNQGFNQEIEDVLFFPDPDAKPEKIKKTQEPAKPNSVAINSVPKEAMPVPFNVDNDPKLKKDVTRKVRSIAQLVEKELGIPVKRGKFRQKALGIYKPGAKVVRTKLSNDLQVIAHEVGHGLSDRFNLATNQDSSFDGELLPLGEKTSGKSYTTEQVREEGRAEFFREFLVNPDGAKKRAPKFYKALTDAIAKDSKTESGVKKLSEAYGDIVSQSAAERVEATIVQEDDIKPKASLKEQHVKRRIETTDKLAALSELTKNVYGDQEINILKDPYRMARLGAGASDVANYFVESGIYDSSGNKISGGLLPIFKEMSSDQIKKFDAYLKARRISIDLSDREITSGVQVKEAQQAVSQLESANPTFKRKANELKGFTDGLIEYSVREDVLTREEADKILEKNTAYIPFARAYERYGSNKTGTVANPFQMIEGDTKDTLSGIAALENNVLMTVRAAANMKIYNALADMAKIPGVGKFIEKVDFGGKDEPIISFVRNGLRENYSISDPLVYESLTYSPEVSAISTGFVASMAKKAATAVNRTAIITPPFVLKNLARDTVAAGAQSKNNFIPVIDTVIGMMEVIGKTKVYDMFKRSGAGQATFTKMLSGNKPKVTKKKNAIDLVLSPLRVLENIAQITEEATRVGDFKKTYKRMKNQGSSEAEAITQAAFEARDLTIDFQKSGRFVQKLNAYIPFLNANVQGKIKTFQTLNTTKGLAGASLLILGPEVLLWSLLKDDEDYDEQPEHIKDNYWLIPGRGGEAGEKFWKVPKPQGYSWFSNKLRNTLNSITGRERDDLDNLSEKLWSDLRSEAVSVIPAMVKPIIEWQTNYSFFRDQQIINQYLEKVPIKDQHNAYTSEVAKKIGPKLGISPIYFDHLIYGYFTNWGKGATTIVDSAFLKKMDEVPAPDKEAGRSTFAELTGLKSFLATNPNYGAVSIQQIFEMNDKISGLKNTMKNRDEAGKKEIINENKELWSKRHKIINSYRRIKSLGKKVKDIYEHKTMSPADKKKELRTTFDKMLEVSRKALD